MPSHVALLRGVNVGGVQVPMADLREVALDLGHEDVATYIRSGNLVFTPSRDADDLGASLRAALAERLGVDVPIVVRARDAFADELEANPFGEPDDPRLLHVVLRDTEVSEKELRTIEQAREQVAAKGSRDEVALVGRTLYLWTPEGFGRSVLAEALGRGGRDGSPMRNATARNLRTMRHLLGLLDA